MFSYYFESLPIVYVFIFFLTIKIWYKIMLSNFIKGANKLFVSIIGTFFVELK
jgi:hypothetical protein